jgi:hypothetical protein
MILPLHNAVFKKFDDEGSVAHAIRNNAPVSGVYILPNTYSYGSSTSSEDMERGMSLMQNGPTMFACVQVQGMGARTLRPFVVSLIIQIIGAGIVSWMVLQTKGLNFKQRVGFTTLYGVAIWVLGILPGWNWWGFSAAYTFFFLFNLVVGWFLAGLAIAKICKP